MHIVVYMPDLWVIISINLVLLVFKCITFQVTGMCFGEQCGGMILDTWDGAGDSKRDGRGLCQLTGSTVLPCLLVHSLGLQQTTHIAFHSTLSSQLLTLAISLFIVYPRLMFCRSWCIVTLFGAVEFGAIGANSDRVFLDTTTARADAHNALPSRNKSIRSAHRHLYNYVTANRAVLLLH